MELLLRKKPYTIGTGNKVVISPVSGLKKGDKVYQVMLDNGVIVLYPESEFKKTKMYKEMEPEKP